MQNQTDQFEKSESTQLPSEQLTNNQSLMNNEPSLTENQEKIEQLSDFDHEAKNLSSKFESQAHQIQNVEKIEMEYHQLQQQIKQSHQQSQNTEPQQHELVNQVNEENMTEAFDKFQDHHHQQQSEKVEMEPEVQMTEESYKIISEIPQDNHQIHEKSEKQQLEPEKIEQIHGEVQNNDQIQQIKEEQIKVQEKINQQVQQKPIQIQKTQPEVKQQKKIFNDFAAYQNEFFTQNMTNIQKQKVQKQKISQQVIQVKQNEKQKVTEKVGNKKKSKKKKIQEESEPLPIVTKEISNKEQIKKQDIVVPTIVSAFSSGSNNDSSNNQNNNEPKTDEKKNESQIRRSSQIIEPVQVSQIIQPSSVAANVIIFQAQKQRIGSVLQYFNQFINKHEKNIRNQKQLIKNVYDEIQKKRLTKQAMFNILKEYFSGYASISKQFYEKSYKFTKNQKSFSLNPLINMKEELKAGIDELIFLRKSTGNEFQRLSDFITNTIEKSLSKTLMEYWGAITTAQIKHKQKREQFQKKQKQFMKRINKIDKVYTKGKLGVSQQEDLFIEMTKFINQEKLYRQCLIEYGLSLIPLKKAFIKAEEILYEQVQIVLNTFKNQTRNVYCLHKNEFVRIQKLEKEIKEKNVFQKLCDLMDSDYVRSVLLAHEKKSFPTLNDKDFQKVFNMVHFETIVGNACELLKGTTSKSFDLKTKSEQVVDTISGNLLIFNKQTSQMKEKFVISNINAKIVSQGVVQVDEVVKGLIFDSNRTVRLTLRDNDRAEELICFLNQIQQSQTQGLKVNK